jgi:diadenosine tetraphosphate (Ap4A) HIT family hydrolase
LDDPLLVYKETIQMSECVFCGILAEKLPVSTVYRDDRCAAFMDIQPVNPGHLLVIPLEHSASLAELDPVTGSHIFAVGQRLAAALYGAAARGGGPLCQGINLFLADGSVAGQDVFHVHLHVIPRYAGDGFGFRFGPDYKRLPPRSELDRVAGQIRAALDDAER